jgi:ribosomal-protein-alanine N-acetyltransferase
VTVRPAEASDLAAIRNLQAASPEASQWDAAGYLSYECVVAEDEGMVRGFLVFRRTAPGEQEILNMAIDPGARRRGTARFLLESTLARWLGTWFLEVRESNLAAIRLYESIGFVRVGRRENYYHDPREPAIVMKFNS